MTKNTVARNKTTTLALVLLTHNNADLLAKVLPEYAEQVDEIILIDDVSTDGIADVAKKHHAKLVTRPLNQDFAAQRNSAFEHITAEWTLFIDVDEYVSPQLWKEIWHIITHLVCQAVRLEREDIFLGEELRHGETHFVSLLRLAKTDLGRNRWRRAVHEVWEVPTADVYTARTPLEHRSHMSITDFLQSLHWYASLEPLARKPYGRVRIWWEMFFFPMAKFFQNYFIRQGWRDGAPGLIHALLMSYYSLITRVYLYEAWHT